MELIYFSLAIITILLAHGIRIYRWKQFICIYEKPNDANLLAALAIGYFLNFLLPYKMGDLARAYFAGRTMKNGKTLALTTVIVDRCLDVLAVGIIFVIIAVTWNYNPMLLNNMLFYIMMAGILTLSCWIIYIWGKRYVKKFLNLIASIFNNRMQLLILNFGWALIQNFKDIFKRINKIMLLISTMSMWLLYGVSYYYLAKAISERGERHFWQEIFVMLFAQDSVTKSTFKIREAGDNFGSFSWLINLYFVIPLMLMLLIAFFGKKYYKSDTGSNEEGYLNLLPYVNRNERLDFLERYFTENDKDYLEAYIQLNQHVSIIRDCSAGSKATTLLCRNNDGLFWRKYAFGEEAQKLYQQIEWIKTHCSQIALPEIVRQENGNLYCYYDMKYSNNSIGMFEYIHSVPVTKSWKMLMGIMSDLEDNLYSIDYNIQREVTLKQYIQNKILDNIIKIKRAKYIKPLMQYPELVINGVNYINPLIDTRIYEEKFWKKFFINDKNAQMHGDLTIENIVCCKRESGDDEYYLIDPNAGCGYESPYLDYAKLLQSLHGGYELLQNVMEVEINLNQINYIYINSDKYGKLLELFTEYIRNKFGVQGLASIYVHELVHWLRLMPYKIIKDEKNAVIYFARMIIIWQEIMVFCEEENEKISYF